MSELIEINLVQYQKGKHEVCKAISSEKTPDISLKDSTKSVPAVPAVTLSSGDVMPALGLGCCSSDVPAVTLPSGDVMPALGLGCCSLKLLFTGTETEEEVRDSYSEALALGYTAFDTAWIYTTEKLLGEAITAWLEEDTSGRSREDIFITSKLPPNAMRPHHVSRLVGKSLNSLGLKYLDMYMLHWPMGLVNTGDDREVFAKDEEGFLRLDTDTNLEEVWKALEKEVTKGSIRNVGICNCSIKQIDRILKVARIRPACIQIEIHVYLQQPELLAYCRAHDIPVVAYAPFGSPGRRELVQPEDLHKIPSPLEDPVVQQIARKMERSPAQILLRHLIQKKVAVIPKTTCKERLKENLDVFNFVLGLDDMERLDNLDRGLRTFDKMGNMREIHPQDPFV